MVCIGIASSLNESELTEYIHIKSDIYSSTIYHLVYLILIALHLAFVSKFLPASEAPLLFANALNIQAFDAVRSLKRPTTKVTTMKEFTQVSFLHLSFSIYSLWMRTWFSFAKSFSFSFFRANTGPGVQKTFRLALRKNSWNLFSVSNEQRHSIFNKFFFFVRLVCVYSGFRRWHLFTSLRNVSIFNHLPEKYPHDFDTLTLSSINKRRSLTFFTHE